MRNCKRCQHEFEPVRTAQLYCSRKCRVADAVSRHRSDYTKARLQGLSDAPTHLSDGSTMVWPSRDDQHGPTSGALQGDDYQLKYYADGYPKLPPCLDRRSNTLAEAA